MTTCPHCGHELDAPLRAASVLEIADARDRRDILELYSARDIDEIDHLWDLIRTTRKTGRIADNVILKELDYWSKFSPAVVMAAIGRYVERDCAEDGLDEKYFRGILRGIAREKDKPMKRKPHRRGGSESLADMMEKEAR